MNQLSTFIKENKAIAVVIGSIVFINIILGMNMLLSNQEPVKASEELSEITPILSETPTPTPFDEIPTPTKKIVKIITPTLKPDNSPTPTPTTPANSPTPTATSTPTPMAVTSTPPMTPSPTITPTITETLTPSPTPEI